MEGLGDDYTRAAASRMAQDGRVTALVLDAARICGGDRKGVAKLVALRLRQGRPEDAETADMLASFGIVLSVDGGADDGAA